MGPGNDQEVRHLQCMIIHLMVVSLVYCDMIHYSILFIAMTGTAACPLLDPPSNGNISITVTTPGSTVSYTCELGYVLAGPVTRTCLTNETWTGSDPVCNRT